MRKFAFFLSGFAALAVTLFVSSTSAIEEPTYSLVAAWDDPMLKFVITTRAFWRRRNERGTESGFRVLAGYIFGGNERSRRLR